MRNKSTVLALALVVAACAGTSTPTTQTPTTQTPTTQAPTTVAPPGEVEITLVDFAFQGLPASVPAGTRLTVKNDSTAELHEIVVFKLPEGETRSAAELS